MYCLIYRFEVRTGQDQRFIEAWSRVTRSFMEHCGGLGSRLHSSGGREFIAYAQWPDREAWEAAELPPQAGKQLAEMRSCCDCVEVLYQLDPVADHLVLIGAVESTDADHRPTV